MIADTSDRFPPAMMVKTRTPMLRHDVINACFIIVSMERPLEGDNTY